MTHVTEHLFSAGEALDAADDALVAGRPAAARVHPTGFPLLDTYLGGGLRSGELCLLSGPQGLGKTAFALQIARYAALSDAAALVVSYEHDATTLLQRAHRRLGGYLDDPPYGVDVAGLRAWAAAVLEALATTGTADPPTPRLRAAG